MRYAGRIRIGSELAFRAMGTDAHLIVVGGHEALADAGRRRLFDLEQRWSRFVPTSEVNRVTAAAGTPVDVSWETALLVDRAVEAWRITGGSFDPTILGDLIRAGYDTSFDRLGGRRGTSDLMVGCTDIEVRGTTVRLPAGTGFDAGGIGKGLAADLVAEEVMAAGAEGVCVNLGGDLRVLGTSPDGPWTVAIEHEWFDEPITLVGLAEGAVATSTTLRRRWSLEGEPEPAHHLIDPHTGAPSTTDLTAATVITGDAWVAEVLAKAILLRGSGHAFDLLRRDDAALVVDREGVVVVSQGFSPYTGVAA